MNVLFMIDYPVEVGSTTMMNCFWILSMEGKKINIVMDKNIILDCYEEFESRYRMTPMGVEDKNKH